MRVTVNLDSHARYEREPGAWGDAFTGSERLDGSLYLVWKLFGQRPSGYSPNTKGLHSGIEAS